MVLPLANRSPRRSFMVGLGLGIVLSGLLMLVLGFWAVRQGITVYVPTRVVAEAVGQEVERDSYVHLPQLLNGLQHSLPSSLASAVFPHLGTGTYRISVGGYWVELPPAVGEQLKSRVTQAFATAVQNYLGRTDRSTLARQMGQTANHLVRYEIATRLQGTRVILQPERWLRIPLRLEFS